MAMAYLYNSGIASTLAVLYNCVVGVRFGNNKTFFKYLFCNTWSELIYVAHELPQIEIQYVKCDLKIELYRYHAVSTGILYLILVKMHKDDASLLLTDAMWFLKHNLLSIITPRIFASVTHAMGELLIEIENECVSFCLGENKM
jgi:hypothetical protein